MKKEKRLEHALKLAKESGLTQAKLAERMNRSDSTISQWKSGSRGFGFDTAKKIARALHPEVTTVTGEWLIGAQGAPPPEWEDVVAEDESDYGGKSIPLKEQDFALLPLVSEQVAAGGPVHDPVQHAEDWYAFRRGWIRYVIGSEYDEKGRIVLMRVARDWKGESMVPTIRPGALVAVDRGPGVQGWSEVSDGSVYLVRPPESEGITLKRVFLAGDHLILWSDNPAVDRTPPVYLKNRQMHSILLGRVRWVSQELD